MSCKKYLLWDQPGHSDLFVTFKIFKQVVPKTVGQEGKVGCRSWRPGQGWIGWLSKFGAFSLSLSFFFNKLTQIQKQLEIS